MSIENSGALALDRALISETIFRYHRAFDRKDWEGCRGLYTETVEVETSGMAGSVAEVQSFPRDKMVRILQRMGPADTASQHYSGNHIIEIDGDSAVCIASSMARTQQAPGRQTGRELRRRMVHLQSGQNSAGLEDSQVPFRAGLDRQPRAACFVVQPR